MRKYIILLALFALIKADSDTCTTGYADSLQNACRALSTDSIKCTLIGANCDVKYSACSDYNPESGFDRSVCTSIIPSDIKKKCVVKTEGGKSVCREDDKVCTDGDNDQTNCVTYKAGEEDQRCVYLPSTGKCEAHYEECSKATSSCADNIPRDHKKNCKIGADSNCVEFGRTCEEGVRVFWDKYGGTTESCFDLETGNLKRCILLSDSTSCQTHYKSCGSITDDKTKCENNYPSSSKDKKCEWKQKAPSEYECTEVERYCEDYLGFNYKESLNDNSSPKTCIQLTSSDQKKVCVQGLNIDGTSRSCQSYWKDCAQGNDNSNPSCSGIKPLNSNRNAFLPDYKCALNAARDTCLSTKKVCSEYDSTNNDVCSELDPENENKECVLSGNTCAPQYKSCESYSLDTKLATKDKAGCEAIIPKDSKKMCSWEGPNDDNKQCKTITKPCDKISDEDLCHGQTLDDTSKRCLYLPQGDSTYKCIESYKTCEGYTAETKTKEICEQIEPTYSDGFYNCTFDETAKTCTKKKIVECESYKIRYSYDHDCNDLSSQITEKENYKCIFNSELKCVKDYISCTNYKGDDKKTCESISLTNTNKKCILKDDKTCEEGKRLCSEYSGNDASVCSNDYVPSSPNKVCSLVGRRCTEIDPAPPVITYNHCSNYRGSVPAECTAITPHLENGEIDTSSRCEWDSSYGCKKVQRECSKANGDESLCRLIIPKDTNKQCAYIGGQCKEQYKTCNLYQTKETTIDETTCEEIMINLYDESKSEKYATHYCKYTAATGQEKATCTAKRRECSKFVITYSMLLENACGNTITPSSRESRCVVESNVCKEATNICSELTGLNLYTNSDLESICQKAYIDEPEEYKCVVNDSNNGCKKVKISDLPQPEPEPESTDNHKECEECKCSAGKTKLNIMVIMALVFFLFA